MRLKNWRTFDRKRDSVPSCIVVIVVIYNIVANRMYIECTSHGKLFIHIVSLTMMFIVM